VTAIAGDPRRNLDFYEGVCIGRKPITGVPAPVSPDDEPVDVGEAEPLETARRSEDAGAWDPSLMARRAPASRLGAAGLMASYPPGSRRPAEPWILDSRVVEHGVHGVRWVVAHIRYQVARGSLIRAR
jgi:hypothetical protein